MELHIQDPNFVQSYTLHEALLKSSINSIRGGGAYAFVTSGGIRLLMEDVLFSNFLNNSAFQLVVGTDAITNEKALKAIPGVTEAVVNLTNGKATLTSKEPVQNNLIIDAVKSVGYQAMIDETGNLDEKIKVEKVFDRFEVVRRVGELLNKSSNLAEGLFLISEILERKLNIKLDNIGSFSFPEEQAVGRNIENLIRLINN